jgi:RNA polymerase sigma-54 factor
MRLDMSQNMRLEQKMKLAPRMIQSMEILQLPMMALQERIEQELVENPVLEQSDVDPNAPEEPVDRADDAYDQDGERDLVIRDQSDNAEDFARLDAIADDILDEDQRSEREAFREAARFAGERDAKLDAMANTPAHGISLQEHLHEQWVFVECPPEIANAGERIIEAIDEKGYLPDPLETLAGPSGEPPTPEELTQALNLIQTLLEPIGVGAHGLQECLWLQLEHLSDELELEKTLVLHHLEDIEMNRYPQIAKSAGVEIERIQEAVEFIRSHLDPHPGRQVDDQHAPVIVPDVIIDYAEDADGFEIRLNSTYSPRLFVSSSYKRMAADRKTATTDRDFLRQKIRSAQWLIESIEQRRSTLLRVVHAVVDAQTDFLESGPEHLHPLPMIGVADQLGIHVGTVSRAVSNKYLQTPRGVIRLRDLFSGGTESASGESLAWEGIKVKLQHIVDHEDKGNPLNDDQIVEALAKVGLTLARRTVAKYRTQLNIPTARKRKKF